MTTFEAELFDNILDDPFNYIGKVMFNCAYRTYTKSDGEIGNIIGTGYFKGMVEHVHKSDMAKLDSISISDGSRHITLQRHVIINIKVDPDWQKKRDEDDHLASTLQEIMRRIMRLENKLKSLGDMK